MCGDDLISLYVIWSNPGAVLRLERIEVWISAGVMAALRGESSSGCCRFG